MLRNGFLSVFIVFIFTNSPLFAATDSVDVVDEVVTWWENYGKYWDDAEKPDNPTGDTSTSPSDN
jgi:hypothetical protein